MEFQNETVNMEVEIGMMTKPRFFTEAFTSALCSLESKVSEEVLLHILEVFRQDILPIEKKEKDARNFQDKMNITIKIKELLETWIHKLNSFTYIIKLWTNIYPLFESVKNHINYENNVVWLLSKYDSVSPSSIDDFVLDCVNKKSFNTLNEEMKKEYNRFVILRNNIDEIKANPSLRPNLGLDSWDIKPDVIKRALSNSRSNDDTMEYTLCWAFKECRCDYETDSDDDYEDDYRRRERYDYAEVDTNITLLYKHCYIHTCMCSGEPNYYWAIKSDSNNIEYVSHMYIDVYHDINYSSLDHVDGCRCRETEESSYPQRRKFIEIFNKLASRKIHSSYKWLLYHVSLKCFKEILKYFTSLPDYCSRINMQRIQELRKIYFAWKQSSYALTLLSDTEKTKYKIMCELGKFTDDAFSDFVARRIGDDVSSICEALQQEIDICPVLSIRYYS